MQVRRSAMRVVSRYLEKRGIIQHPPRRPQQYFNNWIKRLRKVIQEAKKLERPLTSGGKQITDEFFQDSPLWIGIEDLKRLFTGDDWSKGSLDGLLQNVEGFVTELDWANKEESSSYDRRQWWGHLQNSLKFFQNDLNTGHVNYVLRDVNDKASELRGFAQDQERYYVEDGLPKGFSDNLFRLVSLIEQAKEITQEAKPKLDELVRLYLTGWERSDDARPPSESIETLYHTSVRARQLYSSGFSPTVPKMEGLGGSQTDKSGKPAISFTSDLYVAKEIMRTLREAILVAKGQVRADHILDWAKRAGIRDRVLDTFRGIKGDLDLKRKDHVMELYRIYLTYYAEKGTRYNPLFFGDMEALMQKFKGMSPRDVGVLVCSVNMTDPNISYLPSMHEYRVAPKNVVSIDRIIS